MAEAFGQRAAALVILNDLGADGVDTDALGPFVDALEIAPLFAIELDEGKAMLQRLLLGGHPAEDLGALDVHAGGTGKMEFVTRVDADDAEVLAGRLGAIPRTTGDGHLDLGRRPGAPHGLLDPDAETGRILRAEAAPVGADAGLHRADALGVGVRRKPCRPC